MGVQIYLLDQRRVTAIIGGHTLSLGTLRRFFKITEMTEDRNAEFQAAVQAIENRPAPPAVMLADSEEMPLADLHHSAVAAAHLVLGWDSDRSSATDMEWDYLPILGYAVRLPNSEDYVLHDDQNGVLYPMSEGRAVELNILSQAGTFIRRGQPKITNCMSVRPFIFNMVAADCILADGRKAEVITLIENEQLPQPIWYIGKRPCDAARYHPPLPEEEPPGVSIAP